jgi:hypothetical protein
MSQRSRRRWRQTFRFPRPRWLALAVLAVACIILGMPARTRANNSPLRWHDFYPPALASIQLPEGGAHAGGEIAITVVDWTDSESYGPQQITLVPWGDVDPRASARGSGPSTALGAIPLGFDVSPAGLPDAYSVVAILPLDAPAGIYFLDISGPTSDAHTDFFYVSNALQPANLTSTPMPVLRVPAAALAGSGTLGLLAALLATLLLVGSAIPLGREIARQLRDAWNG